MTRMRIIIPAATIEWTKLYLTRGAALLLCVFIFPLAAHASPFDSGISSIQTLFTGTIAKAASLIAIVIGGYPEQVRRDQPGEARHTGEGKMAGVQNLQVHLRGHRLRRYRQRRTAKGTDAIVLKVKQEFAAKAKAKLSQRVEAKPAAKSKKAA